MYQVTEDDRHNDPTLHVFRDKEHCLEFLKERGLDEDMIETFKEEEEVEDDDFVNWSMYDGYYTIDHTKE